MAAQYIHLNDSGSQEETQRFGKRQVLGGFLIGLAFGCVFALSYGGQPAIDTTTAIEMPATLRSQMQPGTLRGTSIIAQSGAKNARPAMKKVGGYITPGGDDIIKNNLAGTSRSMSKKGWVDPQGRVGKGMGVYRFANKYGTNVDGYSPIYNPDEWTESGDAFALGTKGLLAWAGLIVILLGIGLNLVISTSQLS
jgi:photosystem II protein